MTQFTNQAGLPTDAYSATPSATSAKQGITANQKKMGAIAAATVLLGGAVGLALAHSPEKNGTPAPPKDTEAGTTGQETINLPEDIDVAGKVTDGMSFGQAFAAARDEVGMGGVFSWHGHWYNTFEKEEWTSLSLEQRQSYSEQITGEKLPLTQYVPPHTHAPVAAVSSTTAHPIIIEGYLNGQRVMGLDTDHDGIIDTMVMDGPDGQTYRVVDATGNEGLDTIYRYDSLDGKLTGAVVLDHPFVLSNDDFSQHLENTMSQEVVDSILDPNGAASSVSEPDDEDAANGPNQEEDGLLAHSSEPDDTYVNNGNVHDMDE